MPDHGDSSRNYRLSFDYICRRYGQPLRAPMCVVVQEMVASEVAGVMFTVDPVTGDPLKVVVTANYGLGEVC